MLILPAMDLMNGQCVRLVEGDFNKRTDYAVDPAQNLDQFKREGAGWAHIVDLDGARAGRPKQHELITQLTQNSGLQIQCGGGIHDYHIASSLLERGIARIILGSVAIKNPDMVDQLLSHYGPSRIVIALDVRIIDGVARPAVDGWQEVTQFTLWDSMRRYLAQKDGKSRAENFLITDIGTDGKLHGPNLELYTETIEKFPDIRLIASGA